MSEKTDEQLVDAFEGATVSAERAWIYETEAAQAKTKRELDAARSALVSRLRSLREARRTPDSSVSEAEGATREALQMSGGVWVQRCRGCDESWCAEVKQQACPHCGSGEVHLVNLREALDDANRRTQAFVTAPRRGPRPLFTEIGVSMPPQSGSEKK